MFSPKSTPRSKSAKRKYTRSMKSSLTRRRRLKSWLNRRTSSSSRNGSGFSCARLCCVHKSWFCAHCSRWGGCISGLRCPPGRHLGPVLEICAFVVRLCSSACRRRQHVSGSNRSNVMKTRACVVIKPTGATSLQHCTCEHMCVKSLWLLQLLHNN